MCLRSSRNWNVVQEGFVAGRQDCHNPASFDDPEGGGSHSWFAMKGIAVDGERKILVCCDCEGPGRHNKPRCEPCQKKIEDESKAADFLEALGRSDAICCDCGEPGRVGKQRCASCAVKLRNDRRRERQKRKKAAQPTVDKPEPICCDCRGRAQIGIKEERRGGKSVDQV